MSNKSDINIPLGDFEDEENDEVNGFHIIDAIEEDNPLQKK